MTSSESMPTFPKTAGESVDLLLDRLGPSLKVGLPLGIGKPNHLVNELFRRACEDSSLQLDLFTALSLEPPGWSSELERRLVEPLRERLYGEWPELDYVSRRRRDELPENVRVVEFYLSPGKLLGNGLAQQDYVSTNYGDVAGDLRDHGVNAILQLVAPHPGGEAGSPGEQTYSLSSNPDLTLDLLPDFEEKRRRGEAVAFLGQVNRQLPYMPGDAEVPAGAFDAILDDPALDFPLFGAPNRPLATADWMVGLWASSLVRDGGSLQLGIGTLSDGVCHMLQLRHRENAAFRQLLEEAGGREAVSRATAIGGLEPFEEGLFANTEMLVEGLLFLYRAGILRRRASPGTDGEGPSGDAVAHAGFFFGSSAFYEGLRQLSLDQRRELAMTRISWTNRLGGDHPLKEAQRKHARFINETMMVTALGAAVSDALDDGRVVSGVGGQHDFVSMAHRLPGARSILVFQSTRHDGQRLRSNVRWSYGHATIPRHQRDLVVTEYGVADLRGRSDREVVEAMLAVTDARFQDGLVQEAQDAGKLPRSYRLPDRFRENRPEKLEGALAPLRDQGLCPDFPFGTDLEPVEVDLARALRSLEPLAQGLRAPAKLLTAGRHLGPVLSAPAGARPYLERMGLEKPRGLSERLQRRAVLLGLAQVGLI